MSPEQKEEIKSALKSQHGAVFELEIPRADLDEDDPNHKALFFLRKPKTAEIKRFKNESLDEDKRANAIDTLAKYCILYPQKEDLAKLLDELPMAPITIGEHVLKLAGLVRGTETKKA